MQPFVDTIPVPNPPGHEAADAGKIADVQAMMAAEPKPVHVPREPKRNVLADGGPLVLVETRKDLSQLKLPFDHDAA